MKSTFSITLFFLLLLGSNIAWSAEPKADEEVIISYPVNDDLYVAGQNVSVSAKINGDVIGAGANVEVSDSVFGDAILAGGNVKIIGFVIDDIRVAGGDINVFGGAGSDVIVFGGTVIIHENAIIRGDVIVFGGDIEINGTIEGDLTIFGGNVKMNAKVFGEAEMKCGELFMNGIVAGDAIVAAQNLDLGPDAMFEGNLRYWTAAGEVNFGPQANNATYDPSLEMQEDQEPDWAEKAAGGLGFMLFSFFSSMILAFILVLAFGKYFRSGAEYVRKEFAKSFGFGVVFVIGLPMLIGFLMITVIGIPLALLALVLYIFHSCFCSCICCNNHRKLDQHPIQHELEFMAHHSGYSRCINSAQPDHDDPICWLVDRDCDCGCLIWRNTFSCVSAQCADRINCRISNSQLGKSRREAYLIR